MRGSGRIVPMTTGTSTMAKTCTTLSVCRGMALPSPMKALSEKPTTKGSVKRESRLLTAVRVMLSATSPLARWLKRLAVAPPGEAERSMSPTASSGGKAKSLAMPKQTAGSTSTWQSRPTITARDQDDAAKIVEGEVKAEPGVDDAEGDRHEDGGREILLHRARVARDKEQVKRDEEGPWARPSRNGVRRDKGGRPRAPAGR